MSAHRCPECGAIHGIPEPPDLCADCSHHRMNHNDDGGKRKKAYCTVWDGSTLGQCPCADFVEREKVDGG